MDDNCWSINYDGGKSMWQTIFTASLMVTLMRTFPAFVSGIERIKNNQRLSKYLDYTICLVTGEVVYSIAYRNIPENNTRHFYYALTSLTILLAATLMWRTSNLSRSLLFSIVFFIIGYNIINI